MKETIKSTVRLFKAVPIKYKKYRKPTEELLKKILKRGFILSPEVVFNYSNYDELIEIIEEEIGLTGEQMNASFHKSWKKVAEANIEQLVMEQLVHYFTTYGFERLGIYDESSIYIPREELNIPEAIEGFNFVVIRGYTKDELRKKIFDLLQTGIALEEKTIKDIVNISIFIGVTEKDIEKIKNRETKITFYDYLGIVPERPTEFLRYIVFKMTNSSLLIKNKVTINKIKEANKLSVTRLFAQYKNQYGLENLATIFYRFKPLFLALKSNSQINNYINKIRKLAKKYHQPMREDYLNEVTARIKDGTIDERKLKFELARVNIFRKIRLAYALKYRMKDVNSILYKVRNGRGYATKFSFEPKNVAEDIYHIVEDSIINDIRNNVRGKKIYIPQNINYALPTTEKQFTGEFPSGTYISVPKDMIFGIYWDNVRGVRIDLDLSLIGDDRKIGWDGLYRSEDRDILFSGDMTDASKGASELFYIKNQKFGRNVLFVNYFNYDREIEVPFKIIVAQDEANGFVKNYMVNPNNVISIAKSRMNNRQKILGLVVTNPDECRFYFAETYLGNSITSSANNFAENARNYLFNFYVDSISLNEILKLAGAEMVDSKEECDIDLSPETVEKDTIVKLIYGN